MAECRLKDNRILGDLYTPYIVAEVNTSHNGNMDTAKKMIEVIKEIGCDCVKFQSWSSNSLYSQTYYNENPIAERMVKKFSFSKEQQLKLALYCKQLGISFASTAYSKEEVDFLIEKCDVPYIKIASMDLNNYPFIEYIAKTQMPIVLATGMSEMHEIRKAVDTIANTGNPNLCLLHCISIYPPELSTIRLKNITGLQKEFPNYSIGFSDHSIGTEMACAAVALGANLIEKHFTLDKSKIGMDNQMATEPEEMKMLVKSCNNIHLALGSETRLVLHAEQEQRKKMRRSIILTRNMKCGDIIEEKDLDAKRPGIGIAPEKMKEIIGKKLAKDINKDEVLLINDISN